MCSSDLGRLRVHESSRGRWVVCECVGVLDCQGCVKCVSCVDVWVAVCVCVFVCVCLCVYKIIKPCAVGDVQVWAVASGWQGVKVEVGFWRRVHLSTGASVFLEP